MNEFPRLRVGGRGTKALRILADCKMPSGYLAPFHPARVICERMCSVGWIEQRPSGPRGGRRWHATEIGRMVFDFAMAQTPAAQASLMLLDIPPGVIGKIVTTEGNTT
jgi:hypothetical protein